MKYTFTLLHHIPRVPPNPSLFPAPHSPTIYHNEPRVQTLGTTHVRFGHEYRSTRGVSAARHPQGRRCCILSAHADLFIWACHATMACAPRRRPVPPSVCAGPQAPGQRWRQCVAAAPPGGRPRRAARGWSPKGRRLERARLDVRRRRRHRSSSVRGSAAERSGAAAAAPTVMAAVAGLAAAAAAQGAAAA